jgi:hypothetical protein
MKFFLEVLVWIGAGVVLVCAAVMIIIASIPDPTIEVEREKP